MPDPHNLQRFVEAQDPVIERVRGELARGRKASHWMWFVFPQIAGLGHSAMAQAYAIGSLDEARAYLAHPVLGARLRDCTRLANAIAHGSAREVFGSPDDLKFQACMTLFAQVADAGDPFQAALGRYFGGQPHAASLERL